MGRRRTLIAVGLTLGLALIVAVGIYATASRTPPLWSSSAGVRVEWHQEAGPVYGPVLLVDDVMYAKVEGISALDPETGRLIWQVNVPDPHWLAAGNDTIYASGVYALDASTGHVRWHFYPGENSRIVITEPGDSRSVYVACGDGGACALDAATGRARWHRDVGRRVDAMSVAEGIVFVGNDEGDLLAIDAESGSLRWRLGLNRNSAKTGMLNHIFIPALAAAQGTVYAVLPGGTVIALKAESGEERWRWIMEQSRPTTGRTWFPGPPPVVADGVVYIATEYHDLFALEATTGREQWRLEVAWPGRTSLQGTPVPDVSTQPLVLNFVGRNAGEPHWSTVIGSLQRSPVFVNDGFLVSACLEERCAVFVLDQASGSRRWEVVTDGFADEMAVTETALYGGTHWIDDGLFSSKTRGGSTFALALPQ